MPPAMNEDIAPASVMPSSRICPVARFLVEHQAAGIDRLVELSGVGVDAELAEHPLHAEGAGFVGHDRDDARAEFAVAHEAAEHPHERHRGGGLAFASAGVEFGEGFVGAGR